MIKSNLLFEYSLRKNDSPLSPRRELYMGSHEAVRKNFCRKIVERSKKFSSVSRNISVDRLLVSTCFSIAIVIPLVECKFRFPYPSIRALFFLLWHAIH